MGRGGVGVRRIGRVVEEATGREEPAATFTVDAGGDRHRVRVVGADPARRARALRAGERVVIDGVWSPGGGVLLARSVRPVAGA